jgi:hypothetical protein
MARSKLKSSDSGPGKPLSNLAYDLIAVLHEKSRALEAYDQYLEDAEENDEVREVLEEIRDQDQEAIQRLERLLPQVIGGSSGGEFDSDTEADDDDGNPGDRKRGAA